MSTDKKTNPTTAADAGTESHDLEQRLRTLLPDDAPQDPWKASRPAT